MPEFIPCTGCSDEFRKRVEDFANILKEAAPGLADMTPAQLASSGLLHSAVERLRGQQAADTSVKHAFITEILEYLKEQSLIQDWKDLRNEGRSDYAVFFANGRTCVIEAKGCLDGNNTGIFERPAEADEFVIWSLCQNPASNMRKNVRSGIVSRLGADMLSRGQRVDGLVVWDMLCGGPRDCPKIQGETPRSTTLPTGRVVPPPCIYLFPREVLTRARLTSPRWTICELHFLDALQKAFSGSADDVIEVAYELQVAGTELKRRTRLIKNGQIFHESQWSKLKRQSGGPEDIEDNT